MFARLICIALNDMDDTFMCGKNSLSSHDGRWLAIALRNLWVRCLRRAYDVIGVIGAEVRGRSQLLRMLRSKCMFPSASKLRTSLWPRCWRRREEEQVRENPLYPPKTTGKGLKYPGTTSQTGDKDRETSPAVRLHLLNLSLLQQR
ncbi:hypothetical protein PABG_12142 [Paracoccidioides brasiliensis Pb03]|nr:hypothetical protein PABG_12142 [Paracoccidioides brasiliensis Pb03]